MTRRVAIANIAERICISMAEDGDVMVMEFTLEDAIRISDMFAMAIYNLASTGVRERSFGDFMAGFGA